MIIKPRNPKVVPFLKEQYCVYGRYHIMLYLAEGALPIPLSEMKQLIDKSDVEKASGYFLIIQDDGSRVTLPSESFKKLFMVVPIGDLTETLYGD